MCLPGECRSEDLVRAAVDRIIHEFGLGLNGQDLNAYEVAKTGFRTDICSSPLYHDVKARLEVYNHWFVNVLERQGHWIPPGLLHGSTVGG